MGSEVELRKGIARRLQFIEFRLFWEGRINRSDLVEAFGISIPQASADLALYQKLAPNNALYDARAKTYVASPELDLLFGGPEPQDYLARLGSLAFGLNATEAWIGRVPRIATVPYPKRLVTVETLRAVVGAIANSQAIEIHYQSLSRPKPAWRWVTPHALGYDGYRWHARAYCHERKDFRDFVLGRILKLRGKQAHAIDPTDDRAWHTNVTMVIGTHPGLTEAQRRSVELDYSMERGRLEIPVKAAFVHYIKRWLRLDLADGNVRPEQIQIVLLNEEKVDARVRELRGY